MSTTNFFIMRKLILAAVLVLVSNLAGAQESVWKYVRQDVAEDIFDFMRQSIGAPSTLPMPRIIYADKRNTQAILQYYNVGQTYGDNMPWIHYHRQFKIERQDMAMFYLSHEFAHYLLHARQNQFLYPRAGNQYWDEVKFNHHCDPDFVQLLDNVADYMAQRKLTYESRKMKENTRYNCKVAGNQ